MRIRDVAKCARNPLTFAHSKRTVTHSPIRLTYGITGFIMGFVIRTTCCRAHFERGAISFTDLAPTHDGF